MSRTTLNDPQLGVLGELVDKATNDEINHPCESMTVQTTSCCQAQPSARPTQLLSERAIFFSSASLALRMQMWASQVSILTGV